MPGRSSSFISTVGLGQPLGTTTAVLATVAAGYIVAAAGSGFLGDRLGLSRVIAGASLVYGLGLLLGGFGDEWHATYLPVIFVRLSAAEGRAGAGQPESPEPIT